MNKRKLKRAHEKRINKLPASAEQVRYLISKQIDVFGLIESGLAIDATTIK